MTLEDKKRISDIIVSWIGVFSVLIAAGWTSLEYYDNKNRNQTQETLKYVANFNTGKIFDAQTRIASTWNSKAEILSELRNAGNEEKLAKFIIDTASEKDTMGSIWAIIDFYESLATCVNESICDKTSALAFFGDRSVRFYNLHHHFIEATRKELEDYQYAKLLQNFAKMYYETK